jgi:hypothetical protein
LKLFGAAAEVAILPSASFKDNWLLEEQSYRPPFHQWRLLVATLRSASGNHTLRHASLDTLICLLLQQPEASYS